MKGLTGCTFRYYFEWVTWVCTWWSASDESQLLSERHGPRAQQQAIHLQVRHHRLLPHFCRGHADWDHWRGTQVSRGHGCSSGPQLPQLIMSPLAQATNAWVCLTWVRKQLPGNMHCCRSQSRSETWASVFFSMYCLNEFWVPPPHPPPHFFFFFFLNLCKLLCVFLIPIVGLWHLWKCVLKVFFGGGGRCRWSEWVDVGSARGV